MSETKRSMILTISADKALGVVGGSLAAASLGFGVYMNIHGPVASFGHSGDFTVFAQLAAPRVSKRDPSELTPLPDRDDPLDMTSTASIPEAPHPAGNPETRIIASVTLAAVNADTATIFINGHGRTVRVGDVVPTAGEVLEIRPGPRPTVKTSFGLIVPSRAP